MKPLNRVKGDHSRLESAAYSTFGRSDTRQSKRRERKAEWAFETCEPGLFTATAAYDVAEPEGPAGLDDCSETDDDADEEDSSIFACAGAAAIRCDSSVGRCSLASF